MLRFCHFRKVPGVGGEEGDRVDYIFKAGNPVRMRPDTHRPAVTAAR